ncbi:hypothetical protein [Planctomonas sp. JC2975]|uniref:hypothetical protein n=1 Tax=Planctomonas sp. JC2975 TaxID=2729626 RepID=UPI001F0DEEDE|nr:hypothetical protein [Planctomonas sp. JC2975]
MLVPRAERLRPLGTVWRLGVLLLGVPGDAAGEASGEQVDDEPGHGAGSLATVPEPRLYATGSLTRPAEPGRPTFIAESAERRRQLRVAAYRGHFRHGESVNFDARPVALDASLIGASGPLTVNDGIASVRWNTSDPAALTPFDAYLGERVALLADPPEGA